MKKDWKNMSDKELDEFFRQKVEEPDIPFVPEDWEKMKQKLQSPTPGHNGLPWYKNNLFRSLTAIILLGSAWLAWTYRDGGSNTDIQQVQEKQSAPSELVIAKPDQAGEKANWENDSEKNEINNNEEEITIESLGKPKDGEDHLPQFSESNIQTNIKKQGRRNTEFSIPKKREANSRSKLVEGQLPKNQLIMINKVHRNINDLFPKPEKIMTNDLHLMGIKDRNEGKYTVPEPKKADFWHDNRLNVAVLLSPDVSALKINDLHGLGTSAGLHVEYFILPQWSITLGGLYSFKTYQGDEGYQTGYTPSPNGVKGNCWVLDVPLNLRFYAIINELDRWYISSGFSSYFMLREKYQLEYSSGYNPYTSDVNVRNSNQHFMGIMNFSLGYERILTSKLSLQVEPYFKLPITEIGEGGVNLKSAGAFIGLKYRW